MEHLEHKYNQIVEAGGSLDMAADYVIKGAETKEEFLYGLKLLVDSSMQKPPYELPKLYQIQRAYHRHIRKIMGVKSITEAIVGNIAISPIIITKVLGKGPSVISYKTGAPAVQEVSIDQYIDDPEMAEFFREMEKTKKPDQNLNDLTWEQFSKEVFKS